MDYIAGSNELSDFAPATLENVIQMREANCIDRWRKTSWRSQRSDLELPPPTSLQVEPRSTEAVNVVYKPLQQGETFWNELNVTVKLIQQPRRF